MLELQLGYKHRSRSIDSQEPWAKGNFLTSWLRVLYFRSIPWPVAWMNTTPTITPNIITTTPSTRRNRHRINLPLAKAGTVQARWRQEFPLNFNLHCNPYAAILLMPWLPWLPGTLRRGEKEGKIERFAPNEPTNPTVRTPPLPTQAVMHAPQAGVAGLPSASRGTKISCTQTYNLSLFLTFQHRRKAPHTNSQLLDRLQSHWKNLVF